jgi:hypothetical protein
MPPRRRCSLGIGTTSGARTSHSRDSIKTPLTLLNAVVPERSLLTSSMTLTRCTELETASSTRRARSMPGRSISRPANPAICPGHCPTAPGGTPRTMRTSPIRGHSGTSPMGSPATLPPRLSHDASMAWSRGRASGIDLRLGRSRLANPARTSATRLRHEPARGLARARRQAGGLHQLFRRVPTTPRKHRHPRHHS